MVLVRCRESDEDDVHRLQGGLSRLSCAGAKHRMGLRERVSAFEGQRCLLVSLCHQRISASTQTSARRGSGLPATRTCSGRKGVGGWFWLAQRRAPASSTFSNGLPSGSCFRGSGALPCKKRLR